jgi:DNA-directed RNA polymerase subunit RPC12/RpoP
VLGDQTVSREHAVFQQDLSRRWYVGCVSDTNPVVVDGQMVTKRKYVQEGSEVLVGKEHLVVFCGSEATAARHLGDTFVKHACKTCGWTGMLRSTGRGGACPDCGSREVLAENVYAREKEVGRAVEGATSMMSPAQLGNIVSRIRAAKNSRLERTDGREPARLDLSEDETFALGAKADGARKLFGFLLIGSGVTVAWDGTQFVAKSAMVFPPMKINGYTRKEAALKSGDVLRVGSNRFKFVVEEPRASSRPPPMMPRG